MKNFMILKIILAFVAVEFNSASMSQPFFGVCVCWGGDVLPLLLQICSNFAEIFTKDGILADKKL